MGFVAGMIETVGIYRARGVYEVCVIVAKKNRKPVLVYKEYPIPDGATDGMIKNLTGQIDESVLEKYEAEHGTTSKKKKSAKKELPNTAPHTPGSETSEAAAKKVAFRLTKVRAAVLYEIGRTGGVGMTDDELEEKLGYPTSTARKRRTDLFQAGLVVDSGDTRKTRAGCDATVWMISDDGLERYAKIKEDFEEV
jgi:hypothetical protein